MSWTPAVPPPPVEGAPIGTGLDVAVTLTNGVGVISAGVAEGDGDDGALEDSLAVELGPRAVVTPPLGVAGPPVAAAPLGEVQAVAVARMARAAPPAAVSRAPGRAPAMAVCALMEPPWTGAPLG
jgi:hypothetical protein